MNDKYFDEGYAAFEAKGRSAKNPYVGKGRTSDAAAWGLGFYAASEDAAGRKGSEKPRG